MAGTGDAELVGVVLAYFARKIGRMFGVGTDVLKQGLDYAAEELGAG